MRRLELTEIARADLKSIRRYSLRTWGPDQTVQYMAALRDTMKGLVAGTVLSLSHHPHQPRLSPYVDHVRIPANTPQRIANVGDVDLVFYCVCTPRFVQSAYGLRDSAWGDLVASRSRATRRSSSPSMRACPDGR